MKRNNKKGFTIVELVIVIAVIAILAGVMIPTFGSVIADAKGSAAIQAGRSYYTEVTTADILDDGVYNAIDLDKCVNDRTSLGGPAPQNVLTQVKRVRAINKNQ